MYGRRHRLRGKCRDVNRDRESHHYILNLFYFRFLFILAVQMHNIYYNKYNVFLRSITICFTTHSRPTLQNIQDKKVFFYNTRIVAQIIVRNVWALLIIIFLLLLFLNTVDIIVKCNLILMFVFLF